MTPAVRVAALLILAAAGAVPAACREGALPFSARDREPPSGDALVRLTYSAGEDRAPAWSVGGDSVYYVAEGFDPLPPSAGVLVGMPRAGGAVRELLTGVQVGARADVWLVAPTPSPSGERAAYVEMGALRSPDPCGVSTANCDATLGGSDLPPLRSIVLRVRRYETTGSVDLDPFVNVALPGVVVDPSQPTPLFTVHVFPFQVRFSAERTFAFRPSWSPDGQRVAFSDGIGLWTWEPDAGAPAPIPNSTDGVTPAWSPDGQWIAYTTLVRGDSVQGQCSHFAVFPCAVQQRTEYMPAPRRLTLIQPDGSGRVELVDGEEPAWAPDGSRIYFRRGAQIWRIAPDGTGEEPVPSTDGGREPAVSPDGRFLAFTKVSDGSDYDVWVLALAP